MKDIKNIYVYAPANAVTGGPELLHQLVDYLNSKGKNAYIVYVCNIGRKWIIDSTAVTPKEYQNYQLKVATAIEDQSCNAVVMPEIMYDLAFNTKHTQKYYWWLSVDNYLDYNSCPYAVPFKELSFISNLSFWDKLKIIRKRFSKFLRGKAHRCISIKSLQKKGGIHLCQSAYAKAFVTQIGGFEDNVTMLQDYINDEYCDTYSPADTRKKQLLYNPRKGYEITAQILKLIPDCYQCIPLVGYTRSELVDLMKQSRLYIDFGNHPGMDRLPRECAANGCCVITGQRGAAAYYEDYPLDEKYRIDETKNTLTDIANLMVDILENYHEHCNAFDKYRAFIKKQKTDFYRAIDTIFGTHN